MRANPRHKDDMTSRAGHLIHRARALFPALLVCFLVAFSFASPQQPSAKESLRFNPIVQAAGSPGLEMVSVKGRNPTDHHTAQAKPKDVFRTRRRRFPHVRPLKRISALALSVDPEDHPRWFAHHLARIHSGFFPGRAGDVAPRDPGLILRLFPTGPPGDPRRRALRLIPTIRRRQGQLSTAGSLVAEQAKSRARKWPGTERDHHAVASMGDSTIIGARTLADNEHIQCDVCIVGAGPAALALAGELAGTTLRVVLLESGGGEKLTGRRGRRIRRAFVPYRQLEGQDCPATGGLGEFMARSYIPLRPGDPAAPAHRSGS